MLVFLLLETLFSLLLARLILCTQSSVQVSLPHRRHSWASRTGQILVAGSFKATPLFLQAPSPSQSPSLLLAYTVVAGNTQCSTSPPPLQLGLAIDTVRASKIENFSRGFWETLFLPNTKERHCGLDLRSLNLGFNAGSGSHFVNEKERLRELQECCP